MVLLKTPPPLRQSALIVWIAPLVVALQTALYLDLPWWKLDWSFFERTVPVATGITFVLWILLLRGTRGCRHIIVSLGAVWTAASAALAIYRDSAVLGLVALGLAVFWYFYADLLASVFQLPYLNPGKRWFQALPEPIPGLVCDLKFGEDVRKGYVVSRLSLEGSFIVAPKGGFTKKNLPNEAVLQFKGHRVICPIAVISRMPENKGSDSPGIGVQFKNSDQDFTKELADFVELLRGEGHVV